MDATSDADRRWFELTVAALQARPSVAVAFRARVEQHHTSVSQLGRVAARGLDLQLAGQTAGHGAMNVPHLEIGKTAVRAHSQRPIEIEPAARLLQKDGQRVRQLVGDDPRIRESSEERSEIGGKEIAPPFDAPDGSHGTASCVSLVDAALSRRKPARPRLSIVEMR